MSEVVDAIVLGSGPAGAMAASVLVGRGLRTDLVDVGNDDRLGRERIPDAPYHVVRSEDPNQHQYFLGEQLEGVPTGGARVGAQLTPPRQFVTAGTDTWSPYTSNNFFPLQSLAKGGLGAAWGAAVFSYTEAELARCGLRAPDFSRFYQAAVDEVGVSADLTSSNAAHCLPGIRATQPALDLDTNAAALLDAYRRRQHNQPHLVLGPASLAILSRDLQDRQANPYFDMDFWSDVRRSVYRPRYTIEKLEKEPSFRYRPGLLAVSFRETADGIVELTCRSTDDDRLVELRARKLILCAGAINTARLCLASMGLSTYRTSLLSSPYTYIPAIQLRMLGKPASNHRHSMTQLSGVFTPPGSEPLSLQLYSYRSLGLFKLVKELPLPPAAGLIVARLLLNSLMIVGTHHADQPCPSNWLAVPEARVDQPSPLELHYAPEPSVQAARDASENLLIKSLHRLGCIAYGRVRPGHASGIHYAGTVPIVDDNNAIFGSTAEGLLLRHQRVFIADSSGFRFLPAKGLTLTIMANARRVAEIAARSSVSP